MSNLVKIKVFGVGGAGSNAVNRMIKDGLNSAEYYVVNTDAQALNISPCTNKIAIGALGAGGNPEVGRKCAFNHAPELDHYVQGADMVYVTAGMGGGTGTGAAPVVAALAKKAGALTVGVVTLPFSFEGPKRKKNALEGLEELKKYVDCFVVVSNDKLLKSFGNLQMQEAYACADEVLKQAIVSVIDVIQNSSLINLDFMDIKSVMQNAGSAVIGIGTATGKGAAVEAAKRAVKSPLLEMEPKGARKAIINVFGGEELTVFDAYEAVEAIKAETNSDLDVIFGVSTDKRLTGAVMITLILTGFDR